MPPKAKKPTPTGKAAPTGIHRGTAGWDAKTMQIQEAALDILVEKGYGEMSMDEVSARAGVSKRTLYHHFPSKLDLALACVRSLPDWSGWADGKDDLDSRLLRAMNAGASFRIRMPRILATCLTHQNDTPELLDALVNDVLMPRVETMTDFIEHGIAFGDIREDADPVAAMAMVIGLLIFNDAGVVDYGKRGPRLARNVTDALVPYLQA